MISKIQGWFKREETPAAPAQPVKSGAIKETAPTSNPPPSSNDFPRRLPNPSSQAPAPKNTLANDAPAATPEIGLASLEQPAAANNAKSPILAQFAGMMGREEQNEWITGQLEIENGIHVLYYATPETVDKYHGRIELELQKVEMKTFHRGDLLNVRGQLVERPGVAPVYRLTSANLIERPKL